ncbi:MAG TPA: hypothetical protein DHV72_13385 [Serratia grimesii]|uniref:Uncharacterized protein n=1 Tax=Serratia grimesii TaxID=82995 RepID=A0A9C7QYT4_9GAMM|nr:hypothetical protein [Serratia grimesii]HCK00994.1 hypothetical protein [Serratia grimesii]
MRNTGGIGLMLLAWIPIGQASLNAAPVSTVLNQQLVAACNLLTTEHADWGNINAMVRSARICLQRPAGQQQSERIPEPSDYGLAQRSGNLPLSVNQGK